MSAESGDSHAQATPQASGAPPVATGEAARILAVDLPVDFLDRLRRGGADLATARAAELTAAILALVRPDAVFAPLMGPGYDILDLVRRLEQLGFAGHLVAVTAPLPDADAVAREVRSHCRGIAFDIVTVSDPQV